MKDLAEIDFESRWPITRGILDMNFMVVLLLPKEH